METTEGVVYKIPLYVIAARLAKFRGLWEAKTGGEMREVVINLDYLLTDLGKALLRPYEGISEDWPAVQAGQVGSSAREKSNL